MTYLDGINDVKMKIINVRICGGSVNFPLWSGQNLNPNLCHGLTLSLVTYFLCQPAHLILVIFL